MAERKPARLEEYRPVRRAPDDYDAESGAADAGREDVEEYDDTLDEASADGQPDVLLDVPSLKVDEIHLEVDDLHARVSLEAGVLNLLKLHVGTDVSLGSVLLDIKGVEAVAQLKVRLDKVEAIIDRVMTTIDDNPQILTDLTSGLGVTAEQFGQGAEEALGEVGQGAGSAAESVGGGVGEATGELGRAAGQAADDLIEDLDGIADDVRRPSRRAIGSGREALRAGQRPADRAAGGEQADRPGRPPAPSEDRPRRVRRQEPPAAASSPHGAHGDQEGRRVRRPRPE
jgi:pyruvate/2-oxoglutarate dehydrogenase complex dihydrolipoamide acyltransferase (E2) component